MHRTLYLALLVGCVSCVNPGSRPPASTPLCVMSYNLRYASDTPPNAWPQRRPVMRNCLRSINPDIIGTQEGIYAQLKDLANDLPQYSWIGLGREGGSRGEFMAVFYRTKRFEPLEYDHFWLSDTPSLIGSATWGHKNRRMATWVRFLDRSSQRQFYLVNTHLDHEVQPAREQGAALILQRALALDTNLPVILTGDFNAAAGNNKAYDILVNEEAFVDTWTTAQERRGERFGTFHGFRELIPNGPRIDWILTRGDVTALRTEIPICQEDNQHASDHLPVVAWLEFGPGRESP